MMIGTMVVVVSKGTADAYGFDNIWDKSWSGSRLVFPELERLIKYLNSFCSSVYRIDFRY